MSIRGILRGFGLKVGQVTRKTFDARIWELVTGHATVTGGITRTGDEMVRTALYEAANVLLSRIMRFSKLKRWGMDVAKRRGSKRAKGAVCVQIQ
jgi:transposase